MVALPCSLHARNLEASCFRDYRGILKPGERGTVMVIAADRKQARVVFSVGRSDRD
jgi:hypothetical protein